MEYLCLVYGEGAGTEWPLRVDERPARGMRAVEPAVTVRLRNGQIGVSELSAPRRGAGLAGFFILEARDLNDAIRLAANQHAAGAESIAVHPLRRGDGAARRTSGRATTEAKER